MRVDWNAFVDQIQKHQSFLLVSHIRPDCDALGSELGMKRVLEKAGKTVRVVNAHPTPPNLAFIDPDGQLEHLGTHVQADELTADGAQDCILILDTSAWAQIGDMRAVIEASSADKMVLDHHVGQDELGATLHKDTTAEATGHLVVKAADALGVELDAEMAMPLYAAIATDTGWLRFGSVTPETYRVIARLVEAGADPPSIYGDLYERDTLGRLKLRGLILSRTQSEVDGKLMHTFVNVDDFDSTGAIASDTEDAINLTMTVAGTLGAVIFVGLRTGGYKLSFRSRCDMDCNELARQFGGGGHKAAAGAFIDSDLETAQGKVLPVVIEAMKTAVA